MPSRNRNRLALAAMALIATAGTGLAARAPVPGAPEPARAAAGTRPNIVLIQADDETSGEFQERGAMPNTNRLLVRHGTTFTDYIVTTAQCCPSRASLLTGQYAHNHHVRSNGAGYPQLVDKSNVLPVWLQRAGYRTMHVGKFLNGYQKFASPPSEVAPGWDQWHTVLGRTQYYDYDLFVNGGTVHHGKHPSDNVTAVLNHTAARLARRSAPRKRPFFLQLDERAPHGAPGHDPVGHCDRKPMPETRDEDAFAHASLPKPPSFNERHMADKPSFLRALPKLDRRDIRKRRATWRCALEAVRGVDRGVAKVYRAVKNAHELNRTVFMFFSDNGLFFGQHRIFSGKVLPYEEALRLPLVMKVPKRYRDRAARIEKSRAPVSNIDLAPTILALANGNACSAPGDCRTMDGRSLMPLLTRSGHFPRKRGILAEYRVGQAGRYATCDFAAVRTRKAIYVRHFSVVNQNTRQCQTTDQRERYNLIKDPFELRNQCRGGVPGRCPVDSRQVHLEARLQNLRDCAGISGRDQQVDGHPFCE